MYHKVLPYDLHCGSCDAILWGSGLGKRKGLPSPLYASYAACQRFGKPRRWHTGSQAVPLYSPVPTSSTSSDLHGTLSEGLALEMSTIFIHSKRGIGVNLSRQGLVQKSLQSRSGLSTPTCRQNLHPLIPARIAPFKIDSITLIMWADVDIVIVENHHRRHVSLQINLYRQHRYISFYTALDVNTRLCNRRGIQKRGERLEVHWIRMVSILQQSSRTLSVDEPPRIKSWW